MERKIGEIFEYKGEWYQCVNTGFSCADCDIKGDCSDTLIGPCTSRLRKDGKQAKFKKLEKVGEPFERNGYMYQEYKTHTYPLLMSGDAKIPTDNGFAVIIKQTKEDMEENKLKISFEKADYLINKLQEILADYLHGGESDEVIAKFEELLDIEEKHSNSERIEKNLREFDLEAAKSGKPVCTRDGRKARIICFDKKCLDEQILIALVDCGKEESIYFYTIDGKCIDDFSSFGLMMLPEKKEGWAVIRKGDIYETEELAEKELYDSQTAIMIAKINWEE